MSEVSAKYIPFPSNNYKPSNLTSTFSQLET